MSQSDHLKFIRPALKEDLGKDDITTNGVGFKEHRSKGEVIAKERGIISGIRPFKQVFKLLSPFFRYEILVKNGQRVKPGGRVIEVRVPLERCSSESGRR